VTDGGELHVGRSAGWCQSARTANAITEGVMNDMAVTDER